MSAEELEKYETDLELGLYREYGDLVHAFRYIVHTERRTYLANHVDVQVANNAVGDVYFDVSKDPDYGKLCNRDPEQMEAGARVEVSDKKRNPGDFAMWKSSKPGEPAWDSPWGKGRPGWHIECSAMSMKLLGASFDLHGGGQDLQFPHHENEIAQSEGAQDQDDAKPRQPFVGLWMHNGFVRVDEEKMSKSLGNFFTIREVLQRYDAEVVRFFILRAHYRSALNYSDQHLEDARAALTRLYTALKGFAPLPAEAVSHQPDWNKPYGERFRAAMEDDFNTPEAVAVLFDLAGALNRSRDAVLAQQLRALAGQGGAGDIARRGHGEGHRDEGRQGSGRFDGQDLSLGARQRKYPRARRRQQLLEREGDDLVFSWPVTGVRVRGEAAAPTRHWPV